MFAPAKVMWPGSLLVYLSAATLLFLTLALMCPWFQVTQSVVVDGLSVDVAVSFWVIGVQSDTASAQGISSRVSAGWFFSHSGHTDDDGSISGIPTRVFNGLLAGLLLCGPAHTLALLATIFALRGYRLLRGAQRSFFNFACTGCQCCCRCRCCGPPAADATSRHARASCSVRAATTLLLLAAIAAAAAAAAVGVAGGVYESLLAGGVPVYQAPGVGLAAFAVILAAAGVAAGATFLGRMRASDFKDSVNSAPRAVATAAFDVVASFDRDDG